MTKNWTEVLRRESRYWTEVSIVLRRTSLSNRGLRSSCGDSSGRICTILICLSFPELSQMPGPHLTTNGPSHELFLPIKTRQVYPEEIVRRVMGGRREERAIHMRCDATSVGIYSRVVRSVAMRSECDASSAAVVSRGDKEPNTKSVGVRPSV